MGEKDFEDGWTGEEQRIDLSLCELLRYSWESVAMHMDTIDVDLSLY